MAVLAALCCALAVWCRMGPPTRPSAPPGERRRAPGWAQARPDAAPLRARLAAAGLTGAALWGLMGLDPWLAPGIGLLVAGGTVALGRLEPGTTRRRRRRLVLDLPETLDLMAAALEAGAPLRGATRAVADLAPGSTRPGLEAVLARIGVGFADTQAWSVLLDDPHWGPVAQDLARSAETGAAAAQLLRQHAVDARRRRADELTRRARAVGVRSVLPLMTCFLPAFVLVGVVPIVAGIVGDYLNR